MLVDLAVSDLHNSDGLARVGKIAQVLPVIVLVDQEEVDRLIVAREKGIRDWVIKETLTPSRLAGEVRNALASCSGQSF
jgi:DNA-binding response OmpR family regulator